MINTIHKPYNMHTTYHQTNIEKSSRNHQTHMRCTRNLRYMKRMHTCDTCDTCGTCDTRDTFFSRQSATESSQFVTLITLCDEVTKVVDAIGIEKRCKLRGSAAAVELPSPGKTSQASQRPTQKKFAICIRAPPTGIFSGINRRDGRRRGRRSRKSLTIT